MMKMKILVPLYIGIAFLFSGCESFQGPVSPTGSSQEIRVALIKDLDHVTFRIQGPYQILDPLSGEILQEGRRLEPTHVVAKHDGIQIGEIKYLRNRLRIAPRKDVALWYNHKEKRYRGMLDFIKQTENKLLVVNRVEIEDYIRGVLFHEISDRWPMEAMKAQAVAARTYALYQIGQNTSQEYDVSSDVYSQVYGGKSGERYRTNLATWRTSKEVLIYQGKLLPAYYSSSCGGSTENVQELWGHQDLPPLRGRACLYCAKLPHYEWKQNFRLKDVQEELSRNGYALELIEEIRVDSRNASGRVKELEVITRDGQHVMVSGKDFRRIIGPNKIKSNKYDIEMKGYYFDLIGKGWGHGVGMCQWGAYGMAQQRFHYRDILQYYYPGVEIRAF
ncbi:MAG: SpoIID/LytB domain-containing protein [Candidatus Omnitrophica bacterium]|nr:SpoIID/LytB domain-containing protein [Candidatus Omnitrophota bacterium]